MAIVKVLFVEVGDEEYGVPLKNVDEITRTDEVKQINGTEVIKHNDDIYPVIDLAETFDVPGTAATGSVEADAEAATEAASADAATAGGAAAAGGGDAGDGDVAVAAGGGAMADAVGNAATDGHEEGMLVRIRESERQVALKCDAVSSQEEVVVKPLEGILSGTPGLSGTAVLGDGNIVHILDVVTI